MWALLLCYYCYFYHCYYHLYYKKLKSVYLTDANNYWSNGCFREEGGRFWSGYCLSRQLGTRGLFIFFKRFYLSIHERHKETDTVRGRSRLPVGSPMWDLIPGPWDYALSQRHTHSTTKPSRCPRIRGLIHPPHSTSSPTRTPWKLSHLLTLL